MTYNVCHAPLKFCEMLPEMLPEVQTMELYDFLKSMIHA